MKQVEKYQFYAQMSSFIYSIKNIFECNIEYNSWKELENSPYASLCLLD